MGISTLPNILSIIKILTVSSGISSELQEYKGMEDKEFGASLVVGHDCEIEKQLQLLDLLRTLLQPKVGQIKIWWLGCDTRFYSNSIHLHFSCKELLG